MEKANKCERCGMIKREINIIKELETKINEYRKLYAEAVLVREKQFIDLLKERQELLDLIIKLTNAIGEQKKKNHAL